jgi:predicted TPR repeat methyltransferase
LLLAALGRGPIPDRASSAQLDDFYARRANYWDQVAASGEARGYRGAELVASTLHRLTASAGRLDTVDAGCGTGLVGTRIAGKARRLVGVDASWAMLEKAREKAVYGELHHGDLVEFLNVRPEDFDVVTSAATLIHFGDLRPAFEAAATSLRQDGVFVFTLFPNEDDENAIAPGTLDGHAQGGCYRHGGNYVAALAAATGFTVESQCLDVHEYSHGTPRMGLITALRRICRP